jgi:hypothetical protein
MTVGRLVDCFVIVGILVLGALLLMHENTYEIMQGWARHVGGGYSP